MIYLILLVFKEKYIIHSDRSLEIDCISNGYKTGLVDINLKHKRSHTVENNIDKNCILNINKKLYKEYESVFKKITINGRLYLNYNISNTEFLNKKYYYDNNYKIIEGK